MIFELSHSECAVFGGALLRPCTLHNASGPTPRSKRAGLHRRRPPPVSAAYRKWVYLTSGLDMSYLPNALRRLSTFGNVFVNPEAYDAFIESGTWPDKTVLVLEVRRAEQEASINRNGRSQGDIVRTEVHLKDNSRFGGWAFFAFADETPATMIPRTANCYSCHQEHAAVDTTFVQFYPTLLSIARAKKTLTDHYLSEEAKSARK